jgi:hypothetical protein
VIAAYDAPALKLALTALAARWREPNRFGELDAGRTRVRLQDAKNFLVKMSVSRIFCMYDAFAPDFREIRR